MKGQSSLELLITVGVVFAFTIPVLFLLFSITSVGYEDTARAQADASARSLADSVNLVYAEGSGAQRVLLLNVPASTEDIYVSSSEAVVRIKTSSGEFDAASPIIARVAGGPDGMHIGKISGLIEVVVRNNNNEVELSVPPSR
jgi:hypothetical protein